MRIQTWLTGVLAAGIIAAPAHAQSTGPAHSGFDPTAPMGAHYHEGELGEKLMLIETALKCNCSCGLDVHSCQYQMQCAVSPVWTQRIQRSLETGESVEAIQAGFVADFGGTVLMAPPAEGFNLLGYLLPAIGIVTAGMLIGLLTRASASKHPRRALSGPVSSADEERLRDALRRLEVEETPDW